MNSLVSVGGVSEEISVFERSDGVGFFERLVDAFYERVARDPVLLVLYPEPDDLAPARRRLTRFLIQYFGGPTTYSDERGHPRLRMRHFPYAIGPTERDHWLAAMRGALDEVAASPDVTDEVWAYATMAAEAMRNRD